MATMNDLGTSMACMEHQVLEHIKQALLVTLNWKAPAVAMPRKLSSLQFTMKSFQRHFDRVMTIEEEGGYLSDAAAMKPHYQDRVEKLSKEHARFRERIKRIVAELNDTKEWEGPRFERICNDLRSLITDIDRHNQSEIALLQESALVDDGGEG